MLPDTIRARKTIKTAIVSQPDMEERGGIRTPTLVSLRMYQDKFSNKKRKRELYKTTRLAIRQQRKTINK